MTFLGKGVLSYICIYNLYLGTNYFFLSSSCSNDTQTLPWVSPNMPFMSSLHWINKTQPTVKLCAILGVHEEVKVMILLIEEVIVITLDVWVNDGDQLASPRCEVSSHLQGVRELVLVPSEVPGAGKWGIIILCSVCN